MKVLTFNEVVAIDDLPVEEVLIPEWGEDCGVLIRHLSADEKARIEKTYAKKKAGDDPASFYSLLLKLAMVNEDKSPYFQDDNAARFFLKKNGGAIQRIVNAITKAARWNKEDLEDLGKNSGTPQL